MKLQFLLPLFLALTAVPAMAQDTCKFFPIKNPHGMDMSVSKIWVVDTVNFTVESVNPLPFQLGATDSFRIHVCVKARDGQQHTTQVRYQNTHGTSSYTVTMDAPSTSSVVTTAEARTVRVVPNPASDRILLTLPMEGLLDVRVRFYTANGLLALETLPSGYTSGELPISVGQLATGPYVMVVTSAGKPVIAQTVIVAR